MAKFCGQCGSELKEGATFCGECGEKLKQTAAPQPEAVPQQQTVKQEEVKTEKVQQSASVKAEEKQPERKREQKPEDNMSETVKMSFFFWMSFLYAIPVIGWAVCLFNAFINRNKSKRNHARAAILSVLVMLAISLAVTFAVKAAVNMAIEKSGIDIDAIKENGISTEVVMDFLEDKGMLPEELADMAGLMDSVTGILGGEGEINLEGVDSQQINQILEQFSGEDGSMDMEAIMNALSELEANVSSESAEE